MENVYSALDQIISCITESTAYQNCLSYREQMRGNSEIESLIEKIKKAQKSYIRSFYDPKIKEELDALQDTLFQIPIYHSYQESLDEVNEMIETVKDSMNQYFDQLLNEKKN